MKTRQGFVSNSSTSSFICCKCGEIEGGFDSCLSDCEMIECEKGHEIHFSCLEGWDDHESEMKDEDEDVLLSKYCPMCKMEIISKEDVLAFCLQKLDASRDDIVKEMQKKFKTYASMKKTLKT